MLSFRSASFRPGLGALLGCCALLVAAPAQAQNRPGLWEYTVETRSAQQEQARAAFEKKLRSLPAAQRKELQAKVQQAGGAGTRTDKRRMCLTPADARRLYLQLPPAFEARCKPASITRTGERSLKATLACTGEPKTSGEGEYSFSGDTGVSGSTTLRVSPVKAKGKAPAQPADTVTVKLKGEWKGADCGAVKPLPATPAQAAPAPAKPATTAPKKP